MIRAARAFTPPADVIELADKVLVVVEIAGMRTADLRITLTERRLMINGVREKPRHAQAAYHQVEIGFGEFRLEIDLPGSVDRDAVSATYEAGFLEISLPRKAARTVRVVEVNGEQ